MIVNFHDVTDPDRAIKEQDEAADKVIDEVLRPEANTEKAKQDAQARMSKLAKESTPAKTAEQRVKDQFPDAKPVKKED